MPYFSIVEKLLFCLQTDRPSKELRDRLAKVAKEHAEKAKIGIRRTRQKAVSSIRKNKEGVSKDSIARIVEMVSRSDTKCSNTTLYTHHELNAFQCFHMTMT